MQILFVNLYQPAGLQLCYHWLAFARARWCSGRLPTARWLLLGGRSSGLENVVRLRLARS